jgi:hypothetical protein
LFQQVEVFHLQVVDSLVVLFHQVEVLHLEVLLLL